MDTVLGIYAHPDDADVDAGGTLARFVREGSRVVVAVVTDGDAGGSDQDLHQQMGELRRDEQRRACEQLGVTELVFFDGYPDGMVTPSHGLVRDIVALIRRVKPNLILTLSPEYNWSSIYANHPDHRAVGAAVTDAVYPAARNPFAFPELLEEGLEPHVVEEVWFQGGPSTNHVVELDQADIDAKVRAVREHVTQFADLDRMESWIRQGTRDAGYPHGYAGGEEFFRWDTRG